MISFKEYLMEDVSNAQDGLIDAVHLPLYFDNDGVGHAATVLSDVHNHLLGKKTKADMYVPMAGHSSVQFGEHKGKFTSHVLNENLNEETKNELEHLSKIMPREGGQFGGVLIHSKNTIKNKKGMITAPTPTVEYSAPVESVEGKKMKNAQLGIVVDKKFINGKPFTLTSKDRAKFKDHPDVNNIDPSLVTHPQNYTPAEQNEFITHLTNAQLHYAKMKPESLESVAPHRDSLSDHVDMMHKQGIEPNSESYISSLVDEHQKTLNRNKNLGKKDKLTQYYADKLEDAHNNKKHIDDVLQLMTHLHKGKSTLLNIAAKNSPYLHTVNGEAVEPSGIVHIDPDGNKVKLSR